ncbi:DUF1800 family protein [Spirosoma sp. HMF4905]|uniref:DUF1800 family protein n=1 Tax=Spirosoma arboris TaxID=2682092 RepID=A0A7K1SQ58_9BACT|nr:DUF1800 domain-containing protein [Spirosoma arboris]MVM35921.1 DUF1800 family protein [Spirosoma arboris]
MENTGTQAQLEPFRTKWTSDDVKHLLRRTMFGAKPDDVAHLQTLSLKKALNELLVDEPAPAPPINNYNDDKFTDDEIAAGETWTTSINYDGMNNGRRKNSFKAWWLGLMLNQNRTLREKMVVFWHNHFVTETNMVDNALMCYRNNALIRTHALGNFKDLVKAVTKDPAMLKYLNGTSNNKKAPDENYGRELQELFTVGKGPGSHYTEADVKAAAKVLTGFRNDTTTFVSIFDPGRHDSNDKTFSDFYQNTTIKGRRGSEGEQELDDLLTMIFAQDEVARFICRKLYRYFVYHEIDADTEAKVITPLAAVFRSNKYEIKPVLRELFGSQHFFDTTNRGVLIKSPLDFTIGLCREYGIAFPDATAYADQYGLWSAIQNQTASMQQNIGDPPNVAGWPAYYQEPMFDKLWVNSDTLPKRNVFSDGMTNGNIGRNGKKLLIDVVAFTQSLPNPADPAALIDDAVRRLYAIDLPDKDKQYIKTSILLSGLQGGMSDHYWTQAWQNLTTTPDDAANKTNVTKKLKSLYKYLMNLPQYQLT